MSGEAVRGVIFDLDRTLVDSHASEALRKDGKWSQVLALVPECPPYGEIRGALAALRAEGTKVGVVTNSPSKYAMAVLETWSIPVDGLVCYHDTRQHKPEPEPMLLCAHRLGVPPARIICVGDSPDDIRAGAAAGCTTVGVAWGAANVDALRTVCPDAMCDDPAELLHVLNRLWSDAA